MRMGQSYDTTFSMVMVAPVMPDASCIQIHTRVACGCRPHDPCGTPPIPYSQAMQTGEGGEGADEDKDVVPPHHIRDEASYLQELWLNYHGGAAMSNGVFADLVSEGIGQLLHRYACMGNQKRILGGVTWTAHLREVGPATVHVSPAASVWVTIGMQATLVETLERLDVLHQRYKHKLVATEEYIGCLELPLEALFHKYPRMM